MILHTKRGSSKKISQKKKKKSSKKIYCPIRKKGLIIAIVSYCHSTILQIIEENILSYKENMSYHAIVSYYHSILVVEWKIETVIA